MRQKTLLGTDEAAEARRGAARRARRPGEGRLTATATGVGAGTEVRPRRGQPAGRLRGGAEPALVTGWRWPLAVVVAAMAG